MALVMALRSPLLIAWLPLVGGVLLEKPHHRSKLLAGNPRPDFAKGECPPESFPCRTHDPPPEPECPHETCRISPLFAEHVANTSALVDTWNVAAAPVGSTDKVAVTIYQPPTEESLYYLNYAIRTTMHRLGTGWSLQIFYAREHDREELWQKLGRPENVVWSQIRINGTTVDRLNKHAANWFRLSMDFWGEVAPEHEHVLIFESDSLLLKGHGCIDEFLKYDYVGAPWDKTVYFGRRHPPNEGGNGGFTLRKRSTMVKVVQDDLNANNRAFNETRWIYSFGKRERGVGPYCFTQNEDGEVVGIMKKLGYSFEAGNFPPRNQAVKFATERLYSVDQKGVGPCAFHNPWEFLTKGMSAQLLASAEFD